MWQQESCGNDVNASGDFDCSVAGRTAQLERASQVTPIGCVPWTVDPNEFRSRLGSGSVAQWRCDGDIEGGVDGGQGETEDCITGKLVPFTRLELVPKRLD